MDELKEVDLYISGNSLLSKVVNTENDEMVEGVIGMRLNMSVCEVSHVNLYYPGTKLKDIAVRKIIALD